MQLVKMQKKGCRIFAGRTIGRKHATNDDNFGISTPWIGKWIPWFGKGIVVGVYDGVSGGICSSDASKDVAKWMERKSGHILRKTRKHGWKAGRPFLEKMRKKVKWGGETTATVAVIDLEEKQLHTFNVGDSYGYLIREGKERLLTEEHTTRLFDTTNERRKDVKLDLWNVQEAMEILRKEGELFNAGLIVSSISPVPPEESMRTISYNGITAVQENEGILKPVGLEIGDFILLVTDGLSDYFEYVIECAPGILQDIRNRIIVENDPEHMLRLMKAADRYKGDDATFIAVVIDHL